MKNAWMLPLNVFIAVGIAQAQPPPPGSFAPPGGNMDNFFDDEDFEGPPPGYQPPQGQGQGGNKTFNDNAAPPPPSAAAGGEGTGRSTLQPAPRRNRVEPPNLLNKSPKKSMVDATDQDITNENFPDLIDSFDYPNADINDLVKAISELTGKNFIVDPNARNNKITIIAPSRITVAEAYKAFLSALAINGLTVVPAGKFLKIKRTDSAIRDSIDTYSGSFSPNTDALITRIVQLRYISAKDIFNNLGPILVSRLGEMRNYDPTNTLIISDFGSNIERIMKILRQLDVPGFEEQLEVIRIRYAKSSDIAKLVDQIINKGKTSQGPGGGFSSGIPRFTPLGGQTQSSNDAFSLVIPDDRTNSLIVVGNTTGIEKIRKLVAKLDFKIRPEDAGGVYVYYVRYGDAEKIASTLSGLAQASTQSTTTGGSSTLPTQKTAIFGGDVKIVADKTTNSLVVTASKQDYEVVQAILSKLDIPRDQVYVEGIFLEIAMQNQNQWGLSYYNLPTASFAGRSGFSTLELSKILNPGDGEGAVLGLGNGSVMSVTPPGSTSAIQIPSLSAFIKFLATMTTVNVLSTPQIMGLDNEEAEIEVGDKVPTGLASNVSSNGTTSNNVEKTELTIKLNIKPHISPGSNTMRLEITQKIEGVSKKNINVPELANKAITTTKRAAKTSILVRDKDTVVLGGLMTDEESVQSTKVPLLGDIPIIGWLFKSRNTEKTKNNLLMFLTPHIIRNKDDAQNMLTQKLRERVDFIQKNVGGKDAQGDIINKIQVQQGGETVPQTK